MKVSLFCLLAIYLAVTPSSGRRYEGYRVVDVGPLKNDEEVKLIMNLADDDERIREVIVLNDQMGKTHPVSLAVAPRVWARVQEVLDENDIYFVVVNNDLQASFDKNKQDNELRLAKMSSKFRDDPTQFDHTAYLTYADQVLWLQAAAAASGGIAEIEDIGGSYQGRNIWLFKINANTNLPGIWLDANIHAREWISSASCLYVIDQILNSAEPDAAYLRQNFRFYIVANLNPDGYAYTWTTDRMWRKTLSPNAGSTCLGTDPNRNWGSSTWGGEGASNNPCSDTYFGVAPFSESETLAASNYLSTVGAFTPLFISIHSYSQFWLIPWAGLTQHPDDYDELMRVGNLAAAAIKASNGLDFLVGTVPDLLYVASGGSLDWAKEKNGQKYSFSPELRPATAGQGGFDIPASNIVPSGAETLAAVAAAARGIQE